MGKIIKGSNLSGTSRISKSSSLKTNKKLTSVNKNNESKEVKLTVSDYVDNAAHIGKLAQEEVEKRNIEDAKEKLGETLSKEEYVKKDTLSKEEKKKIDNNPKVLTQLDNKDNLDIDKDLSPEEKLALMYNHASDGINSPFSNIGQPIGAGNGSIPTGGIPPTGNNPGTPSSGENLDPYNLKKMSQEEADMMKWRENQEILRQMQTLQLEERLEQVKHFQRMWSMMRAGERYRRQLTNQVLMNQMKTEIDLFNQMWEVI